MLRIYTDKVDNIINFNDAYFNKHTINHLDKTETRNIIYAIDGVVSDGDTIISKFTGAKLDLEHLSTSCKTVLNVVFNTDKVFNAIECGKEALIYMYKQCEGNIYLEDILLPIDESFSIDVSVNYLGNWLGFNSIESLRSWYQGVFSHEC